MAVKRKRLVFNAPFVLGFAFVCVAVLLIGILTGGRSNELLFLVYRAPLDEPLTYIRLFTHVLGHANWGQFDILGNDDNDSHTQNIELISVTLEVFQFDILGNDDNDLHPSNI